MRRRRARLLAWSIVALTTATIPMVRLIVAQPHPGRLGMEGEEGTPLVYIGVLAFSIVGALIVSQHSRHLVGWIFCLSGLAAGVSGVTGAYAELGLAVPGSLPAVSFVNAVSGVAFLVGFFLPTSLGLLLFPDGRLLSRRWRLAVYGAVGGLVLQFVGVLISDRTTIGFIAETAGIAATVAAALTAVASLVVRWQHASDDARQQLKWVGVAGAIVAVELVGEVVLIAFRPALLADASLYFGLAYSCVPAAVGIAILRYRLYDIDFLINRAIVYISLTAILGGLYAGSMTLVQRVFVAMTGQRSDAAIVISAFMLATLFTPARNHLQAFVDKHFKDPRDLMRLMVALERDVESVIGVLSGHRLAERLLDEAIEGTGATSGALYLDGAAKDRPTLTRGPWDAAPALSVPLRVGESEVGQLALGPRRGGAGFARRELERLQTTADSVAVALSMSAESRFRTGPADREVAH
jgi:hypothetical protein